MWYLGQNTNTAKVIVPQLHLDMESRITGSAILFSSCLWVWVFYFFGFPKRPENPSLPVWKWKEETMKDFPQTWVNLIFSRIFAYWQSTGKSNQGIYCKWRVWHCIVMHYISAESLFPYFNMSFLEFTLVQKLSNWIAYFHEHRENGLPFLKFSEFLPLNILFYFVARGRWHFVGCICWDRRVCVTAGLE